MRHVGYCAPAILASALVFSASMASGQQVDAAVTLFNNARVFDGKSTFAVRANQRVGSGQTDRKNFTGTNSG